MHRYARRRKRSAIFIIVALIAGCERVHSLQSGHVTGSLQNTRLVETSGIACPAPDGPAWVLNDGGAGPSLFAVAPDGSDAGEYPVDGAANVDWEDLAIAGRGNGIDLLIADVGDNAGRRSNVTLYLVSLAADGERFTVTRRIDVRYPDGARDVEGVAVDDASDTAYLLTKRTLPVELYRVRLGGDAASVMAERAGPIQSLPQPNALERRLAPIHKNWFWQPTALDFAADGRKAAILTYGGLYLFDREAGADWLDALNNAPKFFPLPFNVSAEAVCFDGDAMLVAFEGRHAPLWRIPLDDEGWQDPPSEAARP